MGKNLRNLCAIATIGLSIALAGPASAQAPVTLKYGLVIALTSNSGKMAQKFAEQAESGTAGRYKIQLFPNSSLGGAREMIEGVQLGTLDLHEGATGPVANFVPELLVFDMPFLFRDYKHAHAVLDGPIGQDMFAKMQAKGMVPLAWSEVGFRHLTNSRRPITSVDDVKGLKVRTMENEVHIAAWRALGAQPTPMAWPDTLVALQQKTIDGQENPAWANLANKMPDMQRYMSMTGHIYTPGILMMSPTAWSKLSDADKAAFKSAAVAMRDYGRQLVIDSDNESVEALRKQGMQVVEVDKGPFQTAMSPVYDAYKKQFGDLIERIRATQ
jgi:tripartite ATP-independent transporter DctP family solute receptor